MVGAALYYSTVPAVVARMTLFATLDCITSPRWGEGGCWSCHDHWLWSFIHPYLKLYIQPTPQESFRQLLDLHVQPCLAPLTPDATIQPLFSFQMKL